MTALAKSRSRSAAERASVLCRSDSRTSVRCPASVSSVTMAAIALLESATSDNPRADSNANEWSPSLATKHA